MSEAAPFDELIRRVRAGDEQAASELVRGYEPAIRRAARVRLNDPRLRRLLDSQDICQSVWKSFFVRAALGQYQLGQPEDLLKLLTTMAYHKVTDQAHQQQAQRRDYRRVEGGGKERAALAPGAGPSQQVALGELAQEARRRLSPQEQHLVELRAQGREWREIAAEVGGTPEALRKQHARTVGRVTRQLGLDEVSRE
jgi:RNA polymerase sigma-70 factor (ECF subfamily)